MRTYCKNATAQRNALIANVEYKFKVDRNTQRFTKRQLKSVPRLLDSLDENNVSKRKEKTCIETSNLYLHKISFHMLRHWKPATFYHYTKDSYVKNFLGHKSMKNTEIYINIDQPYLDRAATTSSPLKSPKTLKRLKNCLKPALNTSTKRTT
ncbi:MAG: hypothetical protein ACLFU9_07840 [Candidatus Bathyarchaeia archaeon]